MLCCYPGLMIDYTITKTLLKIKNQEDITYLKFPDTLLNNKLQNTSLESFQNPLTREEHVHELAVGGTSAQLFYLDKVGLETIVDPIQHIMAAQIFSCCTRGKNVYRRHCYFAVEDDLYSGHKTDCGFQ